MKGRGKIAKVKKIDPEKIQQVYECVKEGMRTNEIYAMMLVHDHELTYPNFVKILEEVYLHTEKVLNKDREYIFQLHMDRYEDIYHKSMELVGGNRVHGVPLNPNNPYEWPVIVSRYKQAMDALRNKEDLLGLHNKKFVFEFNEEKAVVLTPESNVGKMDGVPGYNFDNLTIEEQIELLELVKEARTTSLDGIQKVVIKQIKIEINTETGERGQRQITKDIENIEDVSFEELPQDVVSKFKKIEKKVEEVIPTGTVVADSRPKDVSQPSKEDLEKKIKENVMKEFKERLKAAKQK